MIRARLEREGKRPLVLLGLDARNVQALTSGRPISVELAPLLPGAYAELTIVYGDRLDDIAAQLAEHGVPLPPEAREQLRAIDETP